MNISSYSHQLPLAFCWSSPSVYILSFSRHTPALLFFQTPFLRYLSQNIHLCHHHQVVGDGEERGTDLLDAETNLESQKPPFTFHKNVWNTGLPFRQPGSAQSPNNFGSAQNPNNFAPIHLSHLPFLLSQTSVTSTAPPGASVLLEGRPGVSQQGKKSGLSD